MSTVTIADLVRTNVRALRDKSEWSQEEMAARMRANGLTRWTRTTVAKIETGKLRADRVLDLATYCAAFGISLTELLAGDGELIMDDPGNTKSLLDFRMALVGLAEPTDPTLEMIEEYNLDRIAIRLGLDHQGELRVITYALYGRQSFLELRDERAGISIRPGTRANIAARRGNATKKMLTEMSAAIEEQGAQALIQMGIERLQAAATDDMEDTPEEDA